MPVPGLLLVSCLLLAACGGGDADGDGWKTGLDCSDRDPDVHPDADEICDGTDNNCDGEVDGSSAVDATDWAIDYDGDGHGNPDWVLRTCERPEGYSSVNDDCDDLDADVYPSAQEVCDFLDNDCNDSVDDDALDAATWYRDADHDGHGQASDSVLGCTQPTGYVSRGTDCDDEDDAVYSGAAERCDEVDNDCDGLVDDGAYDAPLWYADADEDGYGDDATSELICEGADGTVTVAGDCDDADPDINPGVVEVCGDKTDNDCDQTDNGCAPNGVIALGDADAALLGAASYDGAGTSVAMAGDLDGDGTDDLMIGAPGDDSRDEGAGAVAIVYGPPEAEEDLANADVLITGMQEMDAAGTTVAGAGDLDGDGYADLLIGAPGADTSEDDAGIAYVIAGPITGSLRLFDADARLKGDEAGEGVATALASAGDMDGDGNLDLLIGAPSRDDEAEDAGVAWLVLGPVDGSSVLSETGIALLGYGEDALAGRAVAAAGDTDGDGSADLLVGAPWDEAGGSFAGAAYLVTGPVTGELLLTHEGLAMRGTDEGDAAGWSVAGAGDTNLDGYDDVVIGAYAADGAATDSGVVYLMHGPVAAVLSLADADAVLLGDEARAYAGWSVASAGDINHDLYPDLIVGARGSDEAATDGGSVHILYGPIEGSSHLEDATAILAGSGSSDLAGSAIAGGGDPNGDGFDDVMVGAPGADGVDTSSGGAWLLYGGGI